ncbi:MULTISPECIES: NUDIX hydrolase [Flavobacteriaceae]|uniref:NUDIX hydrolase n=1 Tax=Flavobacteriaceae TaxID=49546 RepID=UPI001490B43E|nr:MULTISPECIES: NUDIX domain-containing protein [Allomuricauda]MDC6364650.1 NUDIX domain-containing protein [Muricauda sp. AC10]
MSHFDDFIKRLENFVPNVSIDCVLLSHQNGSLHVLLLKWKNAAAWTLPGGFVGKGETMEEAANKVLYERTGIQNIFLKQFHTFSEVKRNWYDDQFNKDSFYQVFKGISGENKEKISAWFSQRFISTGFLALVNHKSVNLIADHLSEKCEWIPLDQLPNLILDHGTIIKKALQQLRIQMNYLPIGKSLLPKKFTMKELQQLYEAILEKKLDRGNFQRKMLGLNMLVRHDKLMTGAANKAPYLYSFNEETYQELLESGIGFSIS